MAVGTTFKPAVLKPNKVSFLLRLKSWQLFTPIALSIAIQAFAELSFTNQAELPPFYEIYTTASMALLMGMLFSWLWVIGSALPRLLPNAFPLPVYSLKLAIILPAIYILLIQIKDLRELLNVSFALPLEFIIPAHLISMAGIFYSLYFVARALKSVELQRPVSFNDFRREFFLLWFFPVGIWLIQPRVNRLFAPSRAS